MEQVYVLYNTAFYEIMVSKDLNKQLERIKEYATARLQTTVPSAILFAEVWCLNVCALWQHYADEANRNAFNKIIGYNEI